MFTLITTARIVVYLSCIDISVGEVVMSRPDYLRRRWKQLTSRTKGLTLRNEGLRGCEWYWGGTTREASDALMAGIQ